MPPRPSRVTWPDAVELSLPPCSPRLATLAVNHFLVPAGTPPPEACRDAFEARPAGERVLWSRREAVGELGVARLATPASALDFDFRVAAARGVARMAERRDGLALEIAPGERRAVAVALNLATLDSVRCRGARARALDAHLVVEATGDGGGRCEATWLGTTGGLRRLLRPAAPRVRFESDGGT
jgi:hypothetical protein